MNNQIKVYVNIKQAGKRKPVLEKKEYLFDEGINTLRGVLAFFTRIEVEKYNNKDEENYLLFDEEQIEGLAEEGKVGFGYIHKDKKVDPDTAVEKTVESFSDGLVRVFQNDAELTQLDDNIKVSEDDVFTFMRLTFLTGRMW